MKTKDYTPELKQIANNLRMISEYMIKINEQPPSKEVNNDCVRLINDVKKIVKTWYLDLEKLSSQDVRLMLEKEITERTLDKREKDLIKIMREL